MMEDFCSGGATLRSLLENKDFLALQPRVKNPGKEDIDFNNAYDDAAAAFLGPNLWDKTLAEFKLEYVDLDDLLGQNVPTDAGHKPSDCSQNQCYENVPNMMQLSPPQEHRGHIKFAGGDHCNQHHSSVPKLSTVTPPTSPMRLPSCGIHEDMADTSFNHDFKFTSKELALATSPGENNFNPAHVSLHDEDLKPQPIVRKSQKHFVPDTLKDDRYWARRRKNNLAAKRSREARRVKENQIVLRASYLEKENNALKEDVMRLKAENDMLRNQLRKVNQLE